MTFQTLVLPVVVFSFCLNIVCGRQAPSEVFIGGLFRCFDAVYNTSTGTYTIVQNKLSSLQLQAFLMAVDHVNNKTDGILDNLLPNTTLKFGVDFNQNYVFGTTSNPYLDGTISAYFLNKTIESTGNELQGVVVLLSDDSTKATVQTINGWEIPTIIAQSSNTEFSHTENYPFNFRMVPGDSFAAVMIYELIQSYGWNKVAVIYTTDQLGLDYFSVFQNAVNQDHLLEYLTIQSLPPNKKSLTTYIDVIKATGATVIVLLMNDASGGLFMYQAYNEGLLVEGTQVVGTCFQTSISDVYSAGANVGNIGDIMKGYLNVKPDPTLYYQSVKGQAFLNSFINTKPTKTIHSDGSISCNSRKDDTGNSLYYYTSVPSLSTCLGIESFDFYKNGSNLDPTVLYSYASVMTLASALDGLIMDSNTDSMFLYQVLLNGSSYVKYDNIVGNISFSSGIVNDNNLGRGDRMKGHVYVIQNYYSSDYTTTNNINGFVNIGTIVGGNTDYEVNFCNDDDSNGNGNGDNNKYHSSNIYSIDCYSAIYRTYDETSVPSDTQPIIYQDTPSSIQALFIFFGIVMILVFVFQVSYYLYYQDTKIIKNSQLIMISIKALSKLFAGIRIILAGVAYSDGSCTAQLWTEHLAFRFFFGTILLKLWRIHRIINTTGLERVRVTERDLIKYVIIHLVILCCLLSVLTGANDAKLAYYSSISANQETLQPMCRVGKTPGGSVAIYMIYSLECFYLLLGLWYLHLTRAAPPIVNETKVIAPIMLGSIAVISILAAIIFALNFNGVQVDMTVTAGFIAVMIPSSVIYTSQKIYLVNTELNKEIQKQAETSSHHPSVTRTMMTTTIINTFNDGLKWLTRSGDNTFKISPELSSFEDSTDYKAALELVRRHKNYVDRVKLAYHNIDVWKSLLVIITDDDVNTLNGTNHGNKSSSVNGHSIPNVAIDINGGSGVTKNHSIKPVAGSFSARNITGVVDFHESIVSNEASRGAFKQISNYVGLVDDSKNNLDNDSDKNEDNEHIQKV